MANDTDADTDTPTDETPTGETRTGERATADVEVNADTERVWDALTTNDGLSAWFGDGSSIDPTIGGSIATPDLASGRPRVGYVTTVVREEQLDFIWWPADAPDQHSSVSITLEPSETDGLPNTIVRIVEQRRLPQTRASCSAGSVAMALSGAWAWRGALLAVAGIAARV